jgi:hypothetical protein
MHPRCNGVGASLYKVRHGDSLRNRNCNSCRNTRTRFRADFMVRHCAGSTVHAYAARLPYRRGLVDPWHRATSLERREFDLGGPGNFPWCADDLHRHESNNHASRRASLARPNRSPPSGHCMCWLRPCGCCAPATQRKQTTLRLIRRIAVTISKSASPPSGTPVPKTNTRSGC